MREDLRLEVRTDPRMLAAVRGAVRAYLQGAGIAGERLEEVVLAVDEACANCIRHAYGNDPGQRYAVSLGEEQDCVLIAVTDRGTPCPESKLALRDLAPPPRDELTPGGLGIQLILRAFDEVVYAAGGSDGNRMEMRLRRGSGNPEEDA